MALLAGDIGGTKTTLALYEHESGPVPLKQDTYRSGDVASLAAVALGYPGGTDFDVDRAVCGVAGPVVGSRATATNLPWAVSEEDLEAALGVAEVKLLNDLGATASGAPHLPPEDLLVLNDKPAQGGIRAVLAPGTGLGEAWSTNRTVTPTSFRRRAGTRILAPHPRVGTAAPSDGQVW